MSFLGFYAWEHPNTQPAVVKASQMTKPLLKVSSDKLGELGIKLRTPGCMKSDLSTTPGQLFLSDNTLTIS